MIQSSGLYDKYAAKWRPKRDVGRCEVTTVSPLGLEETYPLFVILAVCLVASIFVVALEKLYFEIKNTQLK